MFKKIFLLIVCLFIAINGDDKTKHFTITTLTTYGDDDEHFLSSYPHIAFSNNKVYLLDMKQLKIDIYELSGKYLSSLQLNAGKGPGEFSNFLSGFHVINDSIILILDQIQFEMEILDIKGNYINTVKVKFQPIGCFVKDKLIYIYGSSKKKLLWVYNLNGQLIDTLITPFKNVNSPIQWFSLVQCDNDGNFYVTNPYTTEIVKYNKNKRIWSFKDERLGLVDLPITKKRDKHTYGIMQTKGWGNIFIYKDYVIASTFNREKKETIINIIVLDKKTGKFLFKEQANLFSRIKIYNDKFIFIAKNEPYPHAQRISLEINK